MIVLRSIPDVAIRRAMNMRLGHSREVDFLIKRRRINDASYAAQCLCSIAH
jgi:hypothetical protein